MEINRIHESSMIMTPGGYYSLEYLTKENGGITKVYAKDIGFIDVSINTSPIDVSFGVAEVLLTNKMINITASTTQYLLASGSSVDASSTLGRNLQSIGEINDFETKYSYAGLIANMFKYSYREEDYFTRAEFLPCRDDLFELIGTNLEGKCIDTIWLFNTLLYDNVFEVYGNYPSMTNNLLPKEIDTWHIVDIASWLRGVLTVYIDLDSKESLRFKFTNQEYSSDISKLLTKVGIENEIVSVREFPPMTSLVTITEPIWVYYIEISSEYIDEFMTNIGVMTEDTVNHIFDITNYRGTGVEDVKILNNNDKDYLNKFYSLVPIPFDENRSYWVLVGGVYIKIYK